VVMGLLCGNGDYSHVMVLDYWSCDIGASHICVTRVSHDLEDVNHLTGGGESHALIVQVM